MRSRPRRARHFPRRPSKIAIRRGSVRRGGGSRVEMVRRRRVRRGVDDSFDPDDLPVEPTTDEDVDADVLRMMFSCCHPTLTEHTQTALILRLVCGFGTNEVALAFFSEPGAVLLADSRATSGP